ncbi:peptidase A24 [Arthrobacter sp. Leaf234]|uniref:prepilin peptidase n=1 Tax=Arthrobacter sp. Leaf234 TaxID=1736303 RepID=UPI0006FB4094|nr:A24 family peptidase [Arthrobacter sp. Leaf234]KQO01815.1 peptidase A24 [Arthrobacter sp. Leaf234]
MITALAAYLGDAPVAFGLLVAALTAFMVVGVRLSVIDRRTHRLPNGIVLPSYPAAALLLSAAGGSAGEWHRVLGMLGGAAVLWLAFGALHLLYRQGLGFGDVKLAGLLGLYLGFAGWAAVWWGPFLALLLGGAWSLVLVVTRRATLRSTVAFGPFLVAGTALALAVLP